MAWPTAEQRAEKRARLAQAQPTIPGGDVPMTTVTETETTTTAPTVTLTFEQLKELLATKDTGSFSPDAIAQAFAATQKRENVAAPLVSMYNPRGERDHPRPALVSKKVLLNGVELDTDTLLWEEIEALNVMRPGSYRVTKSNGTKTPLTIQDTIGFDGSTLERREIQFPSTNENRHDHRGLLEYCLDVLTQSGQTTDVDRLTALRTELNALRPSK